MADRITAILPVEDMLPAVAQGAIGIACRSSDAAVLTVLASLHCADTGDCVDAERALLAELEGSCRTPIAALARLDPGGRLGFESLIARPDGSEVLRARRDGSRADAKTIGRDAGAELKSRAGEDFRAW